MSNVTIVMYHYVRDMEQSTYPDLKALPVELFREQLDYIGKYYEIVRMQDVFESLRGGRALSKNAALLTFDDGYSDHFDVVFPLLQERNIQGSFFPPGKAIEEHGVLDVNKIHFILASVADKELLIENIFSLMDAHRAVYKLASNEEYFSRLAHANRFDTAEVVFIKRLLQKALPARLREIITSDLFARHVTLDEVAFSRDLYMDVDQLRHMIGHGMYVGSHGWNHDWLDMLQRDEQESELKQSLTFLKKIGSNPSEWAMCYPYGAHNDSLVSLLKSHHCTLALGTEVGIVNVQTDDPFTYKRLDTNDLPKDKNAKPNKWTSRVL